MDLYPLRKNRLRECLQQGWPSLGTHLLSTWPTVTELVGQTGQFDYIEFVAEYAPWTMHDLDNLGRAIELFPGFSGMIKIEQFTGGHLAMRAIGSGIQNILFADVRTAEDARHCVRSVRPEHPEHLGLHGVGLRRDARTVLYAGSKEWMPRWPTRWSRSWSKSAKRSRTLMRSWTCPASTWCSSGRLTMR